MYKLSKQENLKKNTKYSTSICFYCSKRHSQKNCAIFAKCIINPLWLDRKISNLIRLKRFVRSHISKTMLVNKNAKLQVKKTLSGDSLSPKSSPKSLSPSNFSKFNRFKKLNQFKDKHFLLAPETLFSNHQTIPNTPIHSPATIDDIYSPLILSHDSMFTSSLIQSQFS